MKVFDDKFSFKKSFGRTCIRSGGWTDGEVVTPYGIVSIYAQGDDDSYHTTRLDFVHNSKLYMRNFSKRFTQRGIVTKANNFAKEISGM